MPPSAHAAPTDDPFGFQLHGAVPLQARTAGSASAGPTPAVQRSPATAAGAPAEGTDVVGTLIGQQQSPAETYAARHWQQLRDAARAALLAADLAWDEPLRWSTGSPAERAESALAVLWPVVFVPAAWDAAFKRDLDEAVELGLSIGRARQAQVAADDERLAMERYHPAVGKTVGNTLVQRLQRSMRRMGTEYVAAHRAADGGDVDASSLPASGVSDRAAIALLAFARIPSGDERPRRPARPAAGGRGRPRPTAEPRPATPDADAGSRAAALVEQVRERLFLLAAVVGEANLDALAPAYTVLADRPTGSLDAWHRTLARQAQQLELIRGEVLTLLALDQRSVPAALKDDAVAAYARAAGAAHLPEGASLLRLAREEVSALDQRAAMAATRDEADAIEKRDPASIGAADLDALEARADRSTRGEPRRGAGPADLARTAKPDLATADAGARPPDLATDARTSRVSAFRHGALRLADTLAAARAALMDARELVATPFTAHIALDCEALASEIAGIEAVLHQLVGDVTARAGHSAVPLLEDAIVAEAEARFRDVIKTSGVLELGKRVQDLLARVERAHRILATVGFALVMIGVSVAGGLAGAYVGGAVRGALTPTAVAAAGETTVAATVGGVVATVATESLLVGGFQALASDQSFGEAAGENMLAAGFTFGALTAIRWARVLTRAKPTWASGPLVRYLGPGATDLAVGMGANVVARSLLHPDAPVADDQLLDWTTTAASMVIGRWVGSRLTSLHQRLDAAGARLAHARLPELHQLRAELLALEHDLPSRSWTPDDYSALIDTRLAPLTRRIDALAPPPAVAPPAARAVSADASAPRATVEPPPTRSTPASNPTDVAAEPALTASRADVASSSPAPDTSVSADSSARTSAPPDLDAPPRLRDVEQVTRVAKGPAYEQAMAELRAFYAAQEVEAQQVTLTRGHIVDGPYSWDYGHDARRFAHGAIHITFRVHVTPAPGVDATQLAHLRQQVIAGVDQHYNFRPATGGERLHLDIEFVDDPATAHLRVWAYAGDGDANLYEWFVGGDPTTHAHEVTHGAFGAPDEYADPLGLAPGRAHPTDVNVSRDGSLMGDYWQRDASGRRFPAPGTGLRERHLDRIRAQLPGVPKSTATPDSAPQLAPRAPVDRRAALARELGNIRVARVPISGDDTPLPRADQVKYYVSDEDASLIAATVPQLGAGATVTDAGRGLLVRLDTDEWYFERRTTAGIARAIEPGPGGGAIEPNAFTVTFHGFRGVRSVRGVPLERLPSVDRQRVEAITDQFRLLKYGHIGISIGGGRTIYGFTPDPAATGGNEEALLARITANQSVPAIVGDDTEIFDLAARYASTLGWDTEVTTATQLLTQQKQLAVTEQLGAMTANSGRAHDKKYQFPFPAGRDGRFFSDDNTANCATFPGMLGLPIPEPSGRLSQYMPALRKWAQEGPLDLRQEATDGR